MSDIDVDPPAWDDLKPGMRFGMPDVDGFIKRIDTLDTYYPEQAAWSLDWNDAGEPWLTRARYERTVRKGLRMVEGSP